MSFLPRFEFHRSGIGLVPEPGDEGTAVWIEQVPEASGSLRHCTCETSRKRTCPHLHELTEGIRAFQKRFGKRSWDEVFRDTLWYRLASLLVEDDGRSFSVAHPSQVEVEGEGGTVLRLCDDRGRELVRVFDTSPARLHLLERLGATPGDGPWRKRWAVLARLGRFQLTQQERVLEAAGMKSRRQKAEESFWYRLAYHCARELDGERVTFHPAVDHRSGAFTLTCHQSEDRPLLRLTVPRPAVQRILELLGSVFPGQEDLSIHPVPLKTLFRVTEATEIEGDGEDDEGALDVRPVLVALQEDGEERYIERDDFEKFRYGRLVYLPELGVLAELEQPGRERRFRAPRRLQLTRSQVPGFLDDHREEVAEGDVVFEGGLAGIRVFRQADSVELGADDLAEAEARSWYWLSVRYAFGDDRVPLTDLLEARRQGLPFYQVAGGWVDLNSPSLRAAERVFEGRGLAGSDEDGGRLRVSIAELLRLGATSEVPVRIAGARDADAADGEATDSAAEASRRRAELLERLLTLQPAASFEPRKGLTSALRPYQLHGVEWLRFLAENGLSGLLCDDMGLGKTHQAMALMVSLREQDEVDEPFLVVCPTTVLSHWQGKIRDHAPGLRTVLHHGPERGVADSLESGDVLLTSYGVLRNDIEELAGVGLGLVVFDEIQSLKNPATRSWEAASRLDAKIRIGLTGTPIENSLSELKALFDLLLPGYLGSDEQFEERYGDAEAPGADAVQREPLEGLRRTVAPFILRRTKAAVLDELPDKIEDLRFAVLSDDQVALYRRLVGEKGNELATTIRSGTEPVPYMHIFALLNRLKQVCDHPALALGDLDRADELESGKWDLFCELLAEALGNRQKVVVFTQYLGMITLMERLLDRLEVGYSVLTGSSTKRGEIVDRFNRDPDCRVFLGSLKAGGTGIDLVAGSVVVHYDRWWNAAREDQATDRVYRIGQKRAVQVFKLVTEGTLEEKIHAIIERKRRLAASVVQEDSPRLAKIFTREELLELLRPV